MILVAFVSGFITSFSPDHVQSAAAEKVKWVKLKRKDLKFQARFPGEITTKTTEKEKLTTHKFNCTLHDVVYFIGASVHKVEMTDHENMAKISLESFAKTLNGEVDAEKEWILKGNKGMQAIINVPSMGATIDYRVILIGQIQYQVVLTYANDNPDYSSEMAETFFKSFKVKK